MSSNALLAYLSLLFVLVVGCSGSGDANKRMAATTAYDEAVQAVGQGEFGKAADLLSQALGGPGLMGDRLIEATLLHARCLAALDRHDEAIAALQRIQDVAQPEDLHVVRSYLYAKQGKTADAQKEMQAAKRLNPFATPIED